LQGRPLTPPTGYALYNTKIGEKNMTLRQALIETYTERFSYDKPYLNGKLNKIDECETTSDLIYFSMNLDTEGFEMMSKKLNLPGFRVFVFVFRTLDQGGSF
jgi:hypothetical protein